MASQWMQKDTKHTHTPTKKATEKKIGKVEAKICTRKLTSTK